MKYPDAYKGIQKLWIAALASLVMAAIAVVSGTPAGLTGWRPSLQEGEAFAALAVLLLGWALMAGIVVLIIMTISGLKLARKDEPAFRKAEYAFYAQMGVAGLAVVTVMFVPGTDSRFFTLPLWICNALFHCFALQGVSKLAGRLKDEKLKASAWTAGWAVAAIFMAAAIAALFVPASGSAWNAVPNALSLGALALYAVFLYRAKVLLAK